jgi:hypothetical protein
MQSSVVLPKDEAISTLFLLEISSNDRGFQPRSEHFWTSLSLHEQREDFVPAPEIFRPDDARVGCRNQELGNESVVHGLEGFEDVFRQTGLFWKPFNDTFGFGVTTTRNVSRRSTPRILSGKKQSSKK